MQWLQAHCLEKHHGKPLPTDSDITFRACADKQPKLKPKGELRDIMVPAVVLWYNRAQDTMLNPKAHKIETRGAANNYSTLTDVQSFRKIPQKKGVDWKVRVSVLRSNYILPHLFIYPA